MISAVALVAMASIACRDRAPQTAAIAAQASAATPAPEPSHERELAALRAFEEQRRRESDFAALPPSDQVLGPDPYRIAALGAGWVGILRGDSAVVALDRDGAELARLAAPGSPSGLAVSPDADGEVDVLVVGEAARELAHYRARGGRSGGASGKRIERVASVAVEALGMRAVALAPGARTAYVVEERDGRLLAVSLERDRRTRGFRGGGVRELGRCHGPIDVQAAGDAVAVDCLLDHAIEIRRAGGDGEAVRIHHDGPIWSFALRAEPDGGLLIAAGGIEDHPLEREDGGFGYIDSYLYLYRLAPGAAQATRLAAINASELGVVTPKWLAIRVAAGEVSVTASGYATPALVTLTWPDGGFAADPAAAPRVARRAIVPGISAAQVAGDGAIGAADPLLDAWVIQRDGAPRVIPVAGARPARPVLSRIGEALFFTTLMAPWNSSEGKLSRFTCETCHHEGYIDGRVHYTGRGTVHAATRPLYGLGNLRPYFSRALDATMTDMVHAEFRVANRHNGRDPWFALTRADAPWLDHLAGAPAELTPEILREAFMTFLMDFRHRANPAVAGRTRFTERERAGAEVFRERCAGCHEARLIADDRDSTVPFERWESLVLSPAGPIVWSNASYAKTGVEPYVHDRGARVAPLRRLYKKWPYFTSGSARSLTDVLDRFAAGPAMAYHEAAPADPALSRLTADDRAALRAFLDLL